MALPINVGELIENRVVESTRIEYKSDWDSMAVVPTFSNEHNMLVLDLIEAQRVKVKLNLNDFVLPTSQFEEEMRELEEEEEEE